MTNLVCQITPLQAQVSADVLVNGPRKLVVQLPCLECKEHGRKGHQTRQGDEHGLDVFPEFGINKVALVQLISGVSDLVELDRGINEDTGVVDDETDDLNGVLQAQRIPHEP